MPEQSLQLLGSRSAARVTHTGSSFWGDHMRNGVVCLTLSLPLVEALPLSPHRVIAQPQYVRSPYNPSAPGGANVIVTAGTTQSARPESEYVDQYGNRITAVIERPGDDDFVIYAEDLDPEIVDWLYSLQDEQ